MVVNTPIGVRALTIHVELNNKLAVVRSAFYDAQTVKVRLMESVLDLQLASRINGSKQMGLFILKPPSEAGSMSTLEAAIDSVAFRCGDQMTIGIAEDIHALGQDLHRWLAQ